MYSEFLENYYNYTAVVKGQFETQIFVCLHK